MRVNPKLTKFTIDDYIKSCGLSDKNGSPCDYPDLVDVIKHELVEPICIIQDSDMDGVMSTAIVYNWLKKNNIKADVVFHTAKQHGLHDVIEKVKLYNTVIVPDAGSNDDYDIAILDGLGTHVIILDHHEYKQNEDMPAILINCKSWLNGNMLSGGGVCNYVLEENQHDLAACSIISDVMPLNDVYNRYVVKKGLGDITNPFLTYLIGKLNKGAKPTPKFIAWSIAPLVNAVCRSNNQEAKELMFRAFVNEADFDKALSVMRKCHREQKASVEELYQKLDDSADTSHRIVVAFSDGEPTYNGLAAQKLQSKYKRPTIVLRELDNTRYTGSMRSPIPMLVAINESGLAICQGHESASGITLPKSRLNQLLEWSDKLDIDMNPPIDVACELPIKDIDFQLCKAIQDGADLWGHGIEEPLFYSQISNDFIVNIFKKSSNTMRLNIGDGLAFLKFKMPDEEIEEIESLGNDIGFNITYRLGINEYNGVESCQGIIEDIEWFSTKHKVINDFDWDKIFD